MSEAWIRALRFAALPGAETVIFERQATIEDNTPTTRFVLRSLDATGQVIGDDRDYDLLKAAMTPLERLADAEDQADFRLELELSSGVLKRPVSP